MDLETKPVDDNAVLHVLIQEHGDQLQLKAHANQDAAETTRLFSKADGSLRCSPIVQVPAELALHPEFYPVVQSMLAAYRQLE